MEGETNTLKSTASLLAKYKVPQQEKRTSERTELVRYFFEHARDGWMGNRPLNAGYLASRLSHLSVTDLYAFKSMCEDRIRNGYPWGKFFWGSLKASKEG